MEYCRRFHALFTLLLVLALPGALRAQSGSQTISCASEDMERHSCTADTRAGVRLSRQLSGAPCAFGATWGFDQGGIWVDKGCGAEFEVGMTTTVQSTPVAGPPADKPTEQTGQAEQCGDVVEQLSQRLNIRRDQAQAAAGELFALVRSRLSKKDFRQLAAAVPNMDDLLRAAPIKDRLSGDGAWNAVVAAFQKVGLTRESLWKAVPVMVDQVRCRAGRNLTGLLGKALLQ